MSQSQLFEDLKPLGSGRHLPLQFLRHALAEAGRGIAEVRGNEIDHTIAQSLPKGSHPLLEGDTKHLEDAQIDHTAQIVGFHDVGHDLRHGRVDVHMCVNNRAVMKCQLLFLMQPVPTKLAYHFWHLGQKYVPRPPTTVRSMGVLQRGQG